MKISCLSGIAVDFLFQQISCKYARRPLRKLFFRSNGTHQVVDVSAEVTAVSFHKFIVKFAIYDLIKAGICGEFGN